MFKYQGHMKNTIRCLIVSFILFSPCIIFALLPPLYENIAEIKAILEDQRFGKLLQSGETIEEIIKVKDGYEINTNHHQLRAKVIYKPISRPGPAQFDIEFETLKGH